MWFILSLFFPLIFIILSFYTSFQNVYYYSFLYFCVAFFYNSIVQIKNKDLNSTKIEILLYSPINLSFIVYDNHFYGF